jgi:hypothetical protein
VCQAVSIPSVAVHDRDALPGQEPILAEKLLNDRIRATVGQELTIELVPDCQGVVGLHGQVHKPHSRLATLQVAVSILPPATAGAHN